MSLSPDTIRLVLIVGMALMTVIALLSLLRRNLPPAIFLLWALVAILIPVLGPMLAIIGPSRKI
jgi:hypothetical protein